MTAMRRRDGDWECVFNDVFGLDDDRARQGLLGSRRSEMQTRRIPAAGLSACLVGLALSPLGFIAIGALSDFSPAFSGLVLPPLLLSVVFLLRRFLARPRQIPSSPSWAWLLEAASWIIIVGVLYVISAAHLMRGLERLGGVCTAFLTAAGICLPILLLRRSAIEARLARLPQNVAIILLIVVVGISGWAMIAYLAAPPAFIGVKWVRPLPSGADVANHTLTRGCRDSTWSWRAGCGPRTTSKVPGSDAGAAQPGRVSGA
jgi:hypothetical protein